MKYTGVIQFLKNIFPVTVVDAVMIGDGTNKSLGDMLKNGELGGSPGVNVDGRALAQFFLNGRIRVIPHPKSGSTTHEFLSSGKVGYRILGKGGYDYFNLPSSVILDGNQAYIYNTKTNKFEIRTSTYPSANADEIILLSNYGSTPQGFLSDLFDTCEDYSIEVRDIVSTQVNGIGTTQGTFVVDDYIYTCAHSNDEHTNTSSITKIEIATGRIDKSYTHNLGHLNCTDYSADRDMLITGNSSKSNTLVPELYIFKNWKSVLNSSTNLDFNSLEKIVIRFEGFDGEYKWNFCWGHQKNEVWAVCCDVRVVRKIILGTNEGGEFDGTYTISNTWYSEKSNIIGGLTYFKGRLYAGVKGVYGIRCIMLTDDMHFNSQYLHPSTHRGDMQGLQIYKENMLCVSDATAMNLPLSDI